MTESLNIFDKVFDDLDAAWSGFVEQSYHAIVTSHLSLLQSVLVIYVAAFGIGILRGYTSFNTNAAIQLTVVTGLVTFATDWDYYQHVVNFFMHGSDQLVLSILESIHHVEENSVKDQTTVVLKGAWNIFNDIWREGGVRNLGAFVVAFSGYTLILLVAVLGLGLLLICKQMLSILLALGPIFILLKIFKVTENLFDNWLRYLITFMLVPIFDNIILALDIHVLQNSISSFLLVENKPIASLTAFIPIGVICGLSCIATTICPFIASHIAGGFMSNFGQFPLPSSQLQLNQTSGHGMANGQTQPNSPRRTYYHHRKSSNSASKTKSRALLPLRPAIPLLPPPK